MSVNRGMWAEIVSYGCSAYDRMWCIEISLSLPTSHHQDVKHDRRQARSIQEPLNILSFDFD